MKILFIITRADTVGGAQVHVRDLAIYLNQQGHKVLVITGIFGLYNTVLKNNGVESIACDTFIQKISPLQDWQTLHFLIKTIRKFKPDVVTTHSSKAGILGRLASKLTNTPCVFTAHGWAFTEGIPEPSRSIYQWIERLTEPLADKIICVSERDRIIGINSGIRSDKLLTVHNGMPEISNELKASQNSSDDIKIFMVARFDKQKDHLTLIKAFQTISGAQLNLVGDGPNFEEIKNYVNQIGIPERVNFLGFRDNVAEILPQADIFTLISNWEGFPLTIIEAIRAGLPVVASDVGGVAEAIIDGSTGYLIPRGDVEVLRNRLQKLVEDEKLRKDMGNLARQRYESEFTFQHMFEKTFEVYEKVLRDK
ncbi:MAG: glycosyltransferase family 4 protein [Mastigocoleus sp. MO_167.B18]|nr:glycosyltransferase family 4 protein [Mastigocoleus sp. MO_167.B18]